MNATIDPRSRDAKKRQEKLARYPVKFCEKRTCGKRLVPKEDAWGRLEPLAQFEKRRGCDRTCGGAIRSQDRTAQIAEDPTAIRLKPSSAQTLKRAPSKRGALDADTRELLKRALRLHDPDLLQAWSSESGREGDAKRRTLQRTSNERGES